VIEISIEQWMYFALGCFVAALSMLTFLPLLWRRATRLTRRRLSLALPTSMDQIVAERSMLLARSAVRERQLEQQMEAMRSSKARVMTDVGRQTAYITYLDGQLCNLESRASCLESELSDARKVIRQTSGDLNLTRSVLGAMKLAKGELDEAFNESCARLRIFEMRLHNEADIERVAKRELSPYSRLANDNLTSTVAIADPLPELEASASVHLRSLDWRKWAEEASLDALPPGKAIAYLQHYAGRVDEAGARTLSEALGRLPLTLDLAAAYCKRTQMSFSAYAGKMSILMSVAPRERGCPHSVEATFGLAIAEAIKQVPAAETLLAFIALCAPGRIPLTFVKGVSKDESESRAALLALTELGLVKHDRFPDGALAVSAHRAVYALARARTEAGGGSTAAIVRMIDRLIEIYPSDGFDNPASSSLCAQLTPHLLSVCETNAADDVWSVERAELMVRAGNYLHGRQAYARAEPLFQTALAIREREYGATHPETAAALNNLASLLCARGDLAGARPILERALRIFEKAFGPDYSPTGRYQTNYARLLLMIGRPAKALALAKAALATHEKICGPNHSWTSDSARVTADALDALGFIEKARTLRVRYGIMTLDALRKYSPARQFGQRLIRGRHISRGPVAKSH
jgi:tetratricopeptide (TPR) repeat protein